MTPPIVGVVLAGGTGTRLYPASRPDRPKQFLSLGGDRSLLGRTVDRLAGLDHVVVTAGPAVADRVPSHAPEAEVLVEPRPRDTGPALAYAAAHLRAVDDECVLVCVPSDHVLGDDVEPVLRRAARVAADTGDLVAIGVEPDRPATGYGYIEPDRDDGPARVERFVEKPDRDRAARLVDAGWYWNAGMFAWTPDALLREARGGVLGPLVDAIEAGEAAAGFDAVDPVSIDHAVMEHTERARVVPTDVDWTDVGSWDAVGRLVDGPLCDALEIDAAGNVIAGDDTHVTVIGASDLVVAAYDDRVLVVPVDEAERVREAVERLRDAGQY